MNTLHKLTMMAIISFSIILSSSAHAASQTIGILVFEGFLTSDVTAPIEVFGAAAKNKSFSSFEVVADKTIYDDVKLEALIVPSAYVMDDFLSNKDLIEFIKTQSRSASWMTSNCFGAFLLAEAGVLDGKKATTWAGGEAGLLKSYPKIKVQFDQNVVVDDKVITSNGGPISYQSAFLLLEKLGSKKLAQEISAQIQFDRLESAFTKP